MPDYVVYGGTLRSAIEIPELDPLPRSPALANGTAWSYVEPEGPPPDETLTELGAEPIYGDVHARLYRRPGGFRIVVDDTGIFDLDAPCRSVYGYPKADAWPDFVRAHLIGRVLSTAMHLQGRLTLHGSGVVLDDGAVGFLAPKHYGKTTLALALTRAGAKLLTDDTLPIDVGRGIALPGVHSMRVESHIAAQLAGEAKRPHTREGKEVIDHMPESWKQRDPVPLAALYLVAPVDSGEDRPVVERQPLPAPAAVVGLVGHAKIASMLGAWGGPTLLERAAQLTRRIPVYSLALSRDLDALPQVAERLGQWHGSRLVWGSRAVEGTE